MFVMLKGLLLTFLALVTQNTIFQQCTIIALTVRLGRRFGTIFLLIYYVNKAATWLNK
jgi:hypothetical protein